VKPRRYAVLLLTLWLLPQQALAYQINETEKGKRIRWSDDAMALRLNPGFRGMLAEGHAPDALNMALDAWRGLPGVPDFMVKDGDPAEVGHHGQHPSNGVYLLEDWPYEADKLAITVVTYELDSGRLLDADVLVNPHAHFELLDEGEELRAEAYDLAAVLTHEAGHMLGLGESEHNPEATMWPYARMGETHQRTLADDDEEGVIEAYRGPAPLPAMGCGPATVARGSRGPLPGWVLALALSLGVAGLRLRRRLPRKHAGALLGAGLLLLGGGFGGAPEASADDHGGVTHLPAEHLHTHLHGDLAQAERLANLLGERGELRVGRIERIATSEREGLLSTEYVVRDARGEHRFALPGGELGGIGQIVGHAGLPVGGAELVVVDDAQAPAGHARWAYHQDGLVWGGWLGDGPAIELAR
jgi:hypothetical protein